MTTSERIKSDLATARERFPDVENLVLDGELLTFAVKGQEFCVAMPEVYGCSCEAYGPEDAEISCRGSIMDIVATVLEHLGCAAAVDPDSSPGPVPSLLRTASNTSHYEFGLPSGDSDFMEDELSVASVVGRVKAEISELESAFDIRCRIDAESASFTFVTISLPLANLISKGTAEAWGFAHDKLLHLSLPVNEAHYTRCDTAASSRLEVRAWQEQTVDGYAPLDAGVQLVNVISRFWSELCGVRVEGSTCVSTDECLLAKKRSMFDEARAHDGVLLPLASYLMKRLPCLHEYCVICDEPLIFPPLLRPTICTRTLCCYSARAFGKAVTGEFSAHSASLEIWDLLVAMAISAGQMPEDRMRTLFDNEIFPTLFLPGSSEPAFNADEKGFERLRALLKGLSDYRAKEVGKQGIFWLNYVFKEDGDSGDPLMAPLLGWIWDSNRSYLLALHKDERIEELKTPYQYLLLSAPPEMEAAFQDLKSKHGSEFCFHGSNTANWHCILRKGLKNVSGTKLMSAGQAHGPGIYLARDSGTSASYSGIHWRSGSAAPKAPKLDREVTGQRVHDPHSLVMLAICEVAQVPSLKKAGNIWVCPQEAAVVTRFFLVYHAHTLHGINVQVQLTDPTIVGKLRGLTEKWTM